ncbi:hypothetical protein ACHAW6_012503 [Cyclotella cf. meneghiniana]
MRAAFPWRKARCEEATNGDKPLESANDALCCLTSCDPCGAFRGGSTLAKESDHVASDQTENTTLSSNSPIRDSFQSSDRHADVMSLSSTSQTGEMFDNDVDVNLDVTPGSCENIPYMIEDATLCLLDGVCCRRTCDDDESTLETCGTTRRELRRRRSERARKQTQFCCTTISWGPDDEEEVSVLFDPIFEENEYNGGLNKDEHKFSESFMPNTNLFNEENLATPKQRNFSRRVMPVKQCARCGVTNEEANRRMKICSRCKSAYYCSKDCQSKDWYNNHKMTCIPALY